MQPPLQTRTLWALVTIVALLCPGLPAIGGETASTAPSAQTKYYYCYAFTGMRGTLYRTAVMPAGPDFMAMQNAWVEYVRKNYIPDVGGQGAQCGVSSRDSTVAMRETGWKPLYPKKVIDVDWSYWKGADTASLNTTAQKGQYVLCYSDVSQSPVYISGDIHIDVPAAPDPKSTQPDSAGGKAAVDAVKMQFLAYLKQHYGYKPSSPYPAECNGGKKSAADLAGTRDLLHSRFKQDKFIETGWVPR